MNTTESKQNGITLIELLVALSIFSVISVIVVSVLINGIKATDQAQSNVLLQQEANRILTHLTRWHESHSKYNLVLTKDPARITLTPYDEDDQLIEADKLVISTDQYKYAICDNMSVSVNTCTELNKTVEREEKSLSIKLNVIDKNDPQQNFEVKTVISRM